MKMSIISEEIEDIEFDEPFGEFEFENQKYPFWGNPEGRNKTVDYDLGKFNRYAKIGVVANELIEKLKHNIKKDIGGINGRCSFACLIMMKYGIRIGNEDSAMGYASGLEDNEGEVVQTYGTTTLLNKHIKVQENKLSLDFLGKTQVEQHVDIDDPFVIEHAGKYYKPEEPEEKWLGIDYDMLFSFVKSEVGDAFIPKDFRTFCANVTGWKAVKSFLDKPKKEKKSEVNAEVKTITEIVASKLGNTPSIAKRAYIDNRMLDWFKSERLK